MKVGQWVSFINGVNGEVIGQVAKVTGTTAVVVHTNFTRQTTGHISHLTPANAPAEYPTIKKGMWVEARDGSCKGIVISVTGLKLKVVLNAITGDAVLGSHHLFKVIPQPVLDDSKIMDAYTIKGIREAGGEETRRFEATIYKDGKKFAHVSNGGCGGCNDYHTFPPFKHSDLTEFLNSAKQWFEHYGVKPFESDDMWVEYQAFSTKQGVFAKSFCEQFK